MEDRVKIYRASVRADKPIRLTASRCLLPWPSELGLGLSPLLTISHDDYKRPV